jgi:dipeptidyl aminopeptidase/acylaminoacyl peptidase
VPSKLLTFPDEGHWVLKPGNSRVWHAVVMDWLSRYLGGASPDRDSLEAVYSVTK